jgi:uncharacterized repeat protein (TIGR03803 family)
MFAARTSLSVAAAVVATSINMSVVIGETYELVATFQYQGQPKSPLLLAADGLFYGTTYWGGAAGVGTIFRADAAGQIQTVYDFAFTHGANPMGALVQAPDGAIYGTTTRGGSANLGTVFRMDTQGHVVALHSFEGPDGANPCAGLMLATDGYLYGTTTTGGDYEMGIVFRLNTDGEFAPIHSFNWTGGASSYAELMQASDGQLYGTTASGGAHGAGTVFRIDAQGGFGTLHDLEVLDGWNPYAGLIQASDGNLYGTTQTTIFRLSLAGDFDVVRGFISDDGSVLAARLLQADDGALYGMAFRGGDYGVGTAFRLTLDGQFGIIHQFAGSEGALPYAGLIQAPDHYFYGVTSGCEPFGFDCSTIDKTVWPGNLFRMTSAGDVTALHTFDVRGGINPSALIQASDGGLYGTTTAGGSTGHGAVFRLVPGGHLETLHSFGAQGGAFPYAALVQGADSFLYGTTGQGADNNYDESGTVFRMSLSGELTTLHTFSFAEGANPYSALIQAADGFFYGTTTLGGVGYYGTIFKIDTADSFSSLYGFNGIDGDQPMGGLVQSPQGDIYGTTFGGGDHGAGMIFRLDAAGQPVPLHSFAGTDGGHPVTALLRATDGYFYGTALDGGEHNFGVVFRMDAASGEVTTIHSFDNDPDGYQPQSALIQATDGYLYGTTAGGPDGMGTLFRMDTAGAITTLHAFHSTDGAGPRGLIQASDGMLYGTAVQRGPLGSEGGVVFRLSNAGVAVNDIEPDSGRADGGVAVTILGGGFSDNATVVVGGVAGTEPSVLDKTFLYFATPELSPGTLNDVLVTVPNSAGAATAVKIGAFLADFVDVPQLDPFHDYVERIFRNGITAGCAPGSYCPQEAVTRAQMAVFLLKSKHGSGFVPPACQGLFGDVPCPSLFADWIEQLAAEGVTAGCGDGNYCPNTPVTRAQMSVFLLKAKHGSSYAPPACTDVFGDVACPSLFADWIEQLAGEQITGGCGGGNFCPDNPNTRAQMSAFLVKTFGM